MEVMYGSPYRYLKISLPSKTTGVTIKVKFYLKFLLNFLIKIGKTNAYSVNEI